jgi:hypothetical protein
VKRIVDGGITMNDMTSYVQQHSTPKGFMQFEKAYNYSLNQANGANLSDSQIQNILTGAMIATDSEGVHWRSCALKVTAETLLFIAAGTLGIISLSYLYMDHGQNGNITQAQAEDSTTRSQNQSTYQNSAPSALAAANKDQVNIAGDNAQIATLQAQISVTPASQTADLAQLNTQLAAAEKQLGSDQAAFTSDTSTYNQDLSLYTANWLKAQNASADATMNQEVSQYQANQIHDRKVSEITGILSGVLGAAGTLSAIAHCQE